MRREGSRAASASHGTRCASSTGTGPTSAAVPVEGPVRIASTVTELWWHSARRRAQLPWRGRGKVGGRARGRSLCVQWTWLPPQPSLPPQKHAYVHATHMILSLSPVCIDSSLAGVEMCSCWAYLFDGMVCRGCGHHVRAAHRTVPATLTTFSRAASLWLAPTLTPGRCRASAYFS